MKTTYQNQTTELPNSAPQETNQVTCNDGTKDIINGKMPPCVNNGGVKNERVENLGKPNLSAITDNETFLQKHKNHLLLVGAIVIGYLAYKKYKK